MTFLNGDHLRVVSPLTTDGTSLKYGENGQVMYKETLLPLTAKKSLILQNTRLPAHLKKKIEIISANEAPAQVEDTNQVKKTVPARSSLKKSLV